MSPATVTARSIEQTLTIGRQIGRHARPNDVVAVSGILGAGKTQLAKGVADGLDVPDPASVNSPTFVIINEYQGRLWLFHVDAYRLASPTELEDLGFEQLCTAGGVVVVEWADKVGDILPPDRLDIHLQVLGERCRQLELRARGPQSAALLDHLMRDLP